MEGVPWREAQGSQGRLLSLAGFSHLPSGLYPSYLHLNHLEPPSSGSPLLSQLGQPSIFDTQKGQRAGVAGKLGGGLWNGLGGTTTPALQTTTLAVFPKTPAPRGPHSLLGPLIAFWNLLAFGCSSNLLGSLGSS